MKRRHFFETLAVAPTATLVVSQQGAMAQGPGGAGAATASPQTAVADEVAEGTTGYFSTEQFAALRKLGEVLVPAWNGKPGAVEAEAAVFLDFLIGKSPAARQKVYGEGLNALNAGARKRFQKAFGELGPAEAATLLEPLKQPWTFDPPEDPLGRFLREAKADLRTATLNSKVYVTAASAEGRRGGGTGSYMLPLD